MKNITEIMNASLSNFKNLQLTSEERKTYLMMLSTVSKMKKTDSRYPLAIGITWWLIHRRRRLAQQRIRRQHFFRRFRRMIFLRKQMQMQQNIVQNINADIKSAENVENFRLPPPSLPPPFLESRNVSKIESIHGDDFWSKLEKGEVNDEIFLQNFHMKRDTFEFIYNELNEIFSKEDDTKMPGKKELAITIYHMANNADHLQIANMFGVEKSAISSLLKEVCEIIVKYLKEKLSFNSEDEAIEEKIKLSEEKFGVPNCIGYLGSMDIFIVGPNNKESQQNEYFSKFTNTYGLVFQCVVDYKGRISFLSAGLPSGLQNSEILEKSRILEEFSAKFFPKMEVDDEEEEEKPILISDGSYPISNFVVIPYPKEESEFDDKQKEFNNKIQKGMEHFEKIMFKFKMRWRIIHGKDGQINYNANSFEDIALTCSILHNICELRGDSFCIEWSFDELDKEELYFCFRNEEMLNRTLKKINSNNIKTEENNKVSVIKENII